MKQAANDIHRDKKLDALLGKQVRVIWYDGKVSMGLLSSYEDGYYRLLEFSGSAWLLRKSHVKKISRI